MFTPALPQLLLHGVAPGQIVQFPQTLSVFIQMVVPKFRFIGEKARDGGAELPGIPRIVRFIDRIDQHPAGGLAQHIDIDPVRAAVSRHMTDGNPTAIGFCHADDAIIIKEPLGTQLLFASSRPPRLTPPAIAREIRVRTAFHTHGPDARRADGPHVVPQGGLILAMQPQKRKDSRFILPNQPGGNST